MRPMASSRAWLPPGALLLVASLAAALLFPAVSPGALADRVNGELPAPPIEGGVKWLNSAALKLAELRGKVVLIDFWEYTCVNCLRTLPYLKEWHARYKEKGLVIIGVHTPEFAFAKLEENVQRAAREFGLQYPIVIDSNHAIWNSWGNRYWPAKYLIDSRGFVRYYHFGEGAYGNTEQEIQNLLRQLNPRVELPKIMEPVRPEDGPGKVCYPVTPELYAGFERGGFYGTLGNPEGYQPNQVVTFRDSGAHQDGLIYAHGPWRNGSEALISTRKSPYPRDWIALRYHALEVNSVMKPESGTPLRVWLYHDDRPIASRDRGEDVKADPQGRTYVLVDRGRMYNLIKNHAFGQHELKLATSQPGLGVFSFTFVSCVAQPR